MSPEYCIGKAMAVLLQGHITELDTDAIVKATNSTLMGGGGVDGAIQHKSEQRIPEECKRIRATELPQGLPIGKAIIASGGNLKAST